MPSETLILRQGVGIMSTGTYSVPVLSDAAGETFREIWCKCTGAGHVYGSRVNVQVTNDAATSSNAIRAELDLHHTSGAAMGGGSAIHAAAEIGADNAGHIGLLSGLNASIIAVTDVRSLSGAYYALSLQTAFGADNVMPAGTAFMGLIDPGSVKCPNFLDVYNLTAGDAYAWSKISGTFTQVHSKLRVRTSDGIKYIVLYDLT